MNPSEGVYDTSAEIIELVQGFDGSMEDLLNKVARLVDDWGQHEYDQGVFDYKYESESVEGIGRV